MKEEGIIILSQVIFSARKIAEALGVTPNDLFGIPEEQDAR